MKKKIRIRTGFATSSLQGIRLDEARIALFNMLLARRYRQPFILRIEDSLDGKQPANTDGVLDELRWLGLEWDEGPDIGGEHGPYLRSRRSAVYAAFYVKLIEMEVAFPCFCTERELETVYKAQLDSGIQPHYAGGCNRLNRQGRQKKIDQGHKAVLRVQPPPGWTCHYDDLVLGERECQAEEVGAFVVRRSNGEAEMLFTRAIDDSLDGISHRFRAYHERDDLPAQLALLQVLGMPMPVYGHLPMVLGDTRDERQDLTTCTLSQLREAGYHPAAVINYLARLGHSYSGDQLLSVGELAREFHLSKLSREAVFHNHQQLDSWQQLAASARDTTGCTTASEMSVQ